MTRILLACLLLLPIATMAQTLAGPAAEPAAGPPVGGLRVEGRQALATCPVGNCPTAPGRGFGGNGGGPTLSSLWVQGSTVADRGTSEYLANVGLFVGTGDGNGQKVASYVGAMQGPGAGTTWSFNTDVVRGACPGGPDSLYGMPGSGIPFGTAGCGATPGSVGRRNGTVGYELDLTNWDADTGNSGAFVVGLYIQTLGTYTSGAGISFGKGGGATSWHHGVEFAPGTVADAALYDVSDAPFTLLTTGTHAMATIQDGSTGPATLRTEGAHTVAHLVLGGTAPAALSASGTFPLAALTTATATTPVALQAAPGQKVCWAGLNGCVSYDAAARRFYFTDGTGTVVASLRDGGNLVLKGTLTQNGVP